MNGGWIGVDLDGTLAHYSTWLGPKHIGEPIAPMVERVKTWLAEGKEVRIFTARVYPLGIYHVPAKNESRGYLELMRTAQEARDAIHEWCTKHIGRELDITCIKDYMMIECWDDRSVRVQTNTGEPCCGGN